MIQLRDYQQEGIVNIARKMARGAKRVIFQAATGAGKTVVFVAITDSYLKKSPNMRVLILVHRVELLGQAVKSFRRMGIHAEAITSRCKILPENGSVFVAMVETFHRRLAKDPEWVQMVGVMIVDEAHISTHHKVVNEASEINPNLMIIGVTATPVSASAKRPLNKYYDDIVCSISIKHLIAGGFLVQNKTFVPKEIVDLKNVSTKKGDYDEGQMASVFSNRMVVKSVIDLYENVAPGTKAIVFNCTIEHSLTVTHALRQAGYQARHVDGTTDKDVRKEIFEWFRDTPGGVLCNVGIATLGYDEPSIETVILNRATKSEALYLQMCGRGSRPHPGKHYFTILDIGGSVMDLDDWSKERKWGEIFHHPRKHKPGVAPVKECPECSLIVPSGTMVCPECGHVYREEKAEMVLSGDVVAVSELSKTINVQQMTLNNNRRGYKEFYTFFEIGRSLKKQAKIKGVTMTPDVIETMAGQYEILAKQWCKDTGKRFGQWYKDMILRVLNDELKL